MHMSVMGEIATSSAAHWLFLFVFVCCCCLFFRAVDAADLVAAPEIYMYSHDHHHAIVVVLYCVLFCSFVGRWWGDRPSQ
jgi:hypothetical protein